MGRSYLAEVERLKHEIYLDAALEIAFEAFNQPETNQSTALIPYNQPEQIEDYFPEEKKMGFLNRIKRGIEFLQDWFSDYPDEYLISEYGFLKTFVEWD